jgi:hypothetical protein
LLIKDPEVNIEPDDIINQDVTTQNEAPEEEEFEQYHRSQPSLSDPEDPSIKLGMDWDSDEVWERRFVWWVFDDKKRRYQHERMMEQEKQKIEEEKQQIAQIRQSISQKENELKAREAKLADLCRLT